MAIGQLPMFPTAALAIATQTGYLYIMEKNNKLKGLIAGTLKSPTAAGLQERVKNISWIRDEALKVVPASIKAQVKQGYDKMVFVMSSPTSMYTTPASAYATELDKINTLLSGVAEIPKAKADQILKKAEAKLSVESIVKGAVNLTESNVDGAISAKETVVDAARGATRAASKAGKGMSIAKQAGILALASGALYTVYAIYLKYRV